MVVLLMIILIRFYTLSLIALFPIFTMNPLYDYNTYNFFSSKFLIYILLSMNAFLFIFQVCCFYGTTNQISSWLSGRAEGLEIWGGQYLCGGHNLFPLVEIGLTGLPKSGMCAPPPPASAIPGYKL